MVKIDAILVKIMDGKIRTKRGKNRSRGKNVPNGAKCEKCSKKWGNWVSLGE